jgi:hypothetical protein
MTENIATELAGGEEDVVPCRSVSTAEARELYRKTFEVYRDYLKHENLMMNNRITWNGAAQGVLFAALGVVLNGQPNVSPHAAYLRAQLTLIIPILGLSLSVATVAGVLGAGLSARAVLSRWELAVAELLPDRNKAAHWTPALLAGGSRWGAWLGLIPAGSAGLYGIAWTILVFVSLRHF